MHRAIIVSISSDIGHALGRRWHSRGIDVVGTYRTLSPALRALDAIGIQTLPCDLASAASVEQAFQALSDRCPRWDSLVLCPGQLDPIGSFETSDFKAWAQSFEVNFLRTLQLVHGLLPFRNRERDKPPLVLFFAGGGTNSAPLNYSAYTLAKVSLHKMVELLDAEIQDARFVILGPGWVDTKIHQSTLRAGGSAGANLEATLQKQECGNWVPMERVLDCCDWVLAADRGLVSGRNFSVVHDPWGNPEWEAELASDPELYKLRRSGNDRRWV